MNREGREKQDRILVNFERNTQSHVLTYSRLKKRIFDIFGFSAEGT